MNIQDCIFFQLSKASQSGIRFWAGKISDCNVSPVQGLVLISLAEEDRTTSAHLGQRVQLDSATLTGIIDRLEKSGLAERQRNPDDRRAILICLTEKGRQVADKIRGISETANREFLSGLSEDEERILRALLRRIR
ncbi:MAG: MarR family winged helix-turn-helix transcriptional regulator [Desulfococcaceae bacterium]